MLSSYFSYWRGSRADLLEFLTPSSKELDDLHLSFLRAYESIYMANFFETVPMHLFGLPLYLARALLSQPLPYVFPYVAKSFVHETNVGVWTVGCD